MSEKCAKCEAQQQRIRELEAKCDHSEKAEQALRIVEEFDQGQQRYEGYVPFLACPSHGGPSVRTFMDGNQWCAVHPDFIDLQNSPAGFGDTRDAAITALGLEGKP